MSRQSAGRGSAAQTNWKAVARHELLEEPVQWPATCYASMREGANDLAGDFSPEEARCDRQHVQLLTATCAHISSLNDLQQPALVNGQLTGYHLVAAV